jgi:hypothetical protein
MQGWLDCLVGAGRVSESYEELLERQKNLKLQAQWLDAAIIEQLRARRERLKAEIEQIDADILAIHSPGAKRRRGRRYMDMAEREQVSSRMRKYWDMRRAASGDEGK